MLEECTVVVQRKSASSLWSSAVVSCTVEVTSTLVSLRTRRCRGEAASSPCVAASSMWSGLAGCEKHSWSVLRSEAAVGSWEEKAVGWLQDTRCCWSSSSDRRGGGWSPVEPLLAEETSSGKSLRSLLQGGEAMEVVPNGKNMMRLGAF